MRVLLSIKPEFAELIFRGRKKYEFRRTIFKNPEVDSVVVYASAPTQKVIGEFKIDSILSDSPESLWLQTKRYSGISRDFFFEYFTGKDIAYAIRIKKPVRYKVPLDLQDAFNALPPQSFIYLPGPNE